MPSLLRQKLLGYLLLVSLVLLPSILFWDGLWLRFGFRDDYSTLREAHEEPGKLFMFCAAQGRPLYGMLVESTFAELDGINALPWARILGALSIGVVCAFTAWLLERQGWPRRVSLLCGLLLGLLPSAQVVINWGSCWPHAFAAALGVLAFALNDRGLRDSRPLRRLPWVLAGTAVLLCGLLVYQPDALVYVVPLSAGFLVWGRAQTRNSFSWMVHHIALVCLALVMAFVVVKGLFLLEGFPSSKRVCFEADLPGKLLWFLREPLDNVLGLFVLEDSLGRPVSGHAFTAYLVGLVIVLGLVVHCRREGWRHGLLVLVGGLAFCTLAYAVSLIAAERWASYRTLYALTGVVVVFLMHSLWKLGDLLPRMGRHLAFVAMLGLVSMGVIQAAHSSEELFAMPQSRELELLERETAQINPAKGPRVYIVLPDPAATRSSLRYLDEYGSLSADTEWCTKEMVGLILQERFPEEPDVAERVQLNFGYIPPRQPAQYDTVIDLRVRVAGR
jgi:hypothetical protein